MNGLSGSVLSLDNDSLMVLELDLRFGRYSCDGSRQRRLRRTARAKQATVSLLGDENMSLLLVGDKRLDFKIPL